MYSFTYRHLRAPWDTGPRLHLTELVESGRLPPGRAIDLGSGTASNCIFLAQHGFDVTGVDFAAGAIELGRRSAAEAGVTVNFVQDDLTDLRNVTGPFDLLVDYGTFDDLLYRSRDRYLENVAPLARPGATFLMYCFEWEPRWFERPVFARMACEPGEVERRFGRFFDVARLDGEIAPGRWPRGWAVYLMTRTGTA